MFKRTRYRHAHAALAICAVGWLFFQAHSYAVARGAADHDTYCADH